MRQPEPVECAAPEWYNVCGKTYRAAADRAQKKRDRRSFSRTMKAVDFTSTTLTGGFWKKRQQLAREKTLRAVYDRFSDTGRIAAFRCDWKEGMPNRPHYFWDSDVAKWIEGAAYMLAAKRDRKIEKMIDEIVDNIARNQWPDGYFNIWYTLFARDRRFTVRGEHELYCAGHLIEAAVAYYRATGKRKMLDCMIKYAEYIDLRFREKRDTGFTTPGHEELELALVKLFDCTGDERWLKLADFFISERGKRSEPEPDWLKPAYNQSHLPPAQQRTAEGHSVRACYLYSGMADVARLTGNAELRTACKAIFDDIVRKKMYVTGGIGSSSGGEAFTVPYDLPNILAYTESCAAIGLAFFAHRMMLLDTASIYADTIERIIYNGFLSSISLDGKAFFYENPLEILPYMYTRDVSISGSSLHLPPNRRSEVFGCSCCPPNIVRFIPSIANYMYTVDDTAAVPVLYVHQFAAGKTNVELGGKAIMVRQSTNYPDSGKVRLAVSGSSARLAVRIPFWSDGYKTLAGHTAEYIGTEHGYAYFDVADGGCVNIDLGMTIKLVEARPESRFDCGKFAVMRGPVLYCLEGVDNPEPLRDIRLKAGSLRYLPEGPIEGVPCIKARAFRHAASDFPEGTLYRETRAPLRLVPTEALLIPYYAFANRDRCEMQVWCFVKDRG